MQSITMGRMSVYILVIGLLGLSLGLGSGCEQRNLCESDNDCMADNVCVGGLCGSQLKCAKGKVCGNSTDQPKVVQEPKCTAGEKRCNANTLQVCRVDGQSWAELDCGAYHDCRGGACVRRPLAASCGNKKVDKGEQCDDGNQVSGDGCSRHCRDEKVVRWEAPIDKRAPDTFVLGSRQCSSAATRKNFANPTQTLYIVVSPVVCRTNGRPVTADAVIDAHIAHLNKVFGVAKFTFVRGTTRWEDNADQCDVFYDTESTATLNRYMLSNAISVFYANNIFGGNFSIGGFANHSGVVINARAFKADNILAHELGHSLGLDHPHACYHGKESQSSCESTGDELCDTPVDPGPRGVNGLDHCPDGTVKNGQCVVTNCQVVNCPGGEKPLINNLMSYYHCDTVLTPDQIAALRCVAAHQQSGRANAKRPCTSDAECGTAKCTGGFCGATGTTPGGCTRNEDCSANLRCSAGQCVSCVQNQSAAGSDGLCCSNERDGQGTCCTKETCCGPQNNSSFTTDGQCRCNAGFTWTVAVATNDFRCKAQNQPPSCLLDGMWSSSDTQCCNKERDDQGKCCKGTACCSPRNNSYTGINGQCQCQLDHEWEVPNSANKRCKRKAAPSCKKDGESVSRSSLECCSREINDLAKCCTGNGCCGGPNNSKTGSNGTCECLPGFVKVTPGSTTDFRCQRQQAPTCTKDGESSTSDDKCCSKERSDQAKCCTGKECCASRNNSWTAANGRCQCAAGYEWESPQATNDFRCKKKAAPACRKDGESSPDTALCCNKERDDAGVCCSGNGCCAARNNAVPGFNNTCHCLPDHVRTNPGSSNDVRCQKKPTNPGTFSCTFTRALSGHSSLVRAVAISPDGTKILSGSFDKTIKLWEVSTGTLIRTYTGHTGGVMSVNFRPDGTEFASGGFDKMYRRWKLNTGSFISSLTMGNPIQSLDYTPDGKTVGVGTQSGISLWTINGGGYSFRTGALIHGVAFSSQNQMALARDNKTIELVRTSDKVLKSILKGHSAKVTSVAFNQAGTSLASGSSDIRIWDPSSGKSLRTFQAHAGTTHSLKFHPKKTELLFSAGNDNNIKVWDANTGTSKQTLTGHFGEVYSIAISRDGKTLVSGSGDKTVRVWNCQ